MEVFNIKDEEQLDRIHRIKHHVYYVLMKNCNEEYLIKNPHLNVVIELLKCDCGSNITIIDSDYYTLEKMLINDETFESFMKSPIRYIVKHKYNSSFYLLDKLSVGFSKEIFNDCINYITSIVPNNFSVLEVGIGSGSLCRRLLSNDNFNPETYVATDYYAIKLEELDSSLYCNYLKWDDIFKKTKIVKEKWNIDEPYINNTKYDLVCGSNSIHTCKNLLKSLTHCKNLLKDNGILYLEEICSFFPCAHWGLEYNLHNLVEDERKYILWCTPEEIINYVQKAGFIIKKVYNNTINVIIIAQK